MIKRFPSLSCILDDNVCQQRYVGSGTIDDPYIVDYLHEDGEDAMNFRKGRKWTVAIFHSHCSFAVTFASSVFASGIRGVKQEFDVSEEVATLGLSLFVLGFALGPAIWAPLSELYGRKCIFVVSFTAYVAFSVGAACAPNITTLLILRFLASAFGSSTMTNSGGIIADMFRKEERGLATGMFAITPFLGPALGPVVGGFLNEREGWRWILRLVAISSGVMWIATALISPETYAPFILQRRARHLSKTMGSVYISRLDAGKPPKRLLHQLLIALTRPWLLLFCEPIVLLSSLYITIIYGTLYMFFAGFPIIFELTRGWSQGIAGLPFLAVVVGVCLAMVMAVVDNKRYSRICVRARTEGRSVEPEARLSNAMIGSVILPIGLFLFAWTTYPSLPWILPIIGAILFSCGLVMVFISFMSYLVDSYVVYAASAMAANSMLRSVFGSAFPLFTTQMYRNLGNQWASSVPAFLVLGCLPFPFLFYKFGAKIRAHCRYASEAAELAVLLQSKLGQT